MTVKAKIFSPIPHFLYFLRAHNTCSDFFGFFTFSGIVKIPKSDLWNFHTNVDPIQKRSADLPQIPVNRSRCTGTSLHVRIIPAFAGIHCCHKHKISRIFITCIQPCYTDFSPPSAVLISLKFPAEILSVRLKTGFLYAPVKFLPVLAPHHLLQAPAV